MKRATALALGATLIMSLSWFGEGSAQEAFPHETHSVFFSECSECHQASTEWQGRMTYPDPATCAACHNGTSAPAIAWQPPGPRESNLRFTHVPHDIGCQACHLPQGPENLGALAMPQAETCVGCHAPGVSHQQADDCSYCHRGVQELDVVSPRETGSFHEEGFVSSHGAAASLGQPDCNGCHTESSCLSCHDGQSSPGFHPLNFLASHGPEAYGRVSDCSGCHSTEAFCRDCHVGLGMQAGGAPLSTPFHDDQPVWVLSHSQAARQDLESCVSCHQQTDCLLCHSASGGWGVNPHGPGFNPSSIADRNDLSCTLCHTGG